MLIAINSYPDKMKGNISFPSGDRTIRFQFYTYRVGCNEFRKALFLKPGYLGYLVWTNFYINHTRNRIRKAYTTIFEI